MNERIALALAVCLSSCRAVRSDAPAPDGADDGVGMPADFLVEIPYEDVHGLVVVTADVEGLARPLRLAIDAGGPTALRLEVARDIALVGRGTDMELTDASGEGLPGRTAILESLTIGGATFTSVPTAILEMKGFDSLCAPLDGTLGVGLGAENGFLDRVPVEIDPTRMTVRLADTGRKLAPGGISVPCRRLSERHGRRALLTTSLKVDLSIGKTPVSAVLDTGNAQGTSITRHMYERLGYDLAAEGAVEWWGARGAAAGGSARPRSWAAYLHDVRFGDFELPLLPVEVEVDADSDAWQTGFVLGQDLFDRFTLVIDRPAGEARFIPTAEEPMSEHEPDFGLTWKPDDDARITALRSPGPALDAGVRIDDELLELDGIRVEDHDAACHALDRFSTAEKVQLALRQGERVVELELERTRPVTAPRCAPVSSSPPMPTVSDPVLARALERASSILGAELPASDPARAWWKNRFGAWHAEHDALAHESIERLESASSDRAITAGVKALVLDRSFSILHRALSKPAGVREAWTVEVRMDVAPHLLTWVDLASEAYEVCRREAQGEWKRFCEARAPVVEACRAYWGRWE